MPVAPALSPAQAKTIRYRYANGTSMNALAREYNVCRATIQRVITYGSGYHTTVPPHLRRNRRHMYSDKQVALVRHMWVMGMSMAKIANAVGIPNSTVQLMISYKTYKWVPDASSIY